MRYEIFLLFLQVILFSLSSCHHTGDTCQKDSDCDYWLTCVNNVCDACRKVGTRCEPGATGFLTECCQGSTCEAIPGLNGTSQCRPNKNKCLSNRECSDGLKCLMRLGKCGMCRENGEKCSLPYDDLECCSSYCKITENSVTGTCSDPRISNIPCTGFNLSCETDSDCCKSKYNKIICATSNHRLHIIGYHMLNVKHCTMAHL